MFTEPSLVGNNPIAPMIFNEFCNGELFKKNWGEQFLIRELTSRQVVIMDNAVFHKSEKVKELIEFVSCKLLFLPPYSPALNPIEKFLANMKHWLTNKIQLFSNLKLVIDFFFALPSSS